MIIPEPIFAGVFGLGGPELLLILAVVLLLFGAKKLPELAKGLGKSVKEFKKASAEADAEIEQEKTQIATHASVSTPEPKKVERVETTRSHPTNN